jgi:hypothetical protein
VDATAKTVTVREASASSPSAPSTPPAQPAGKTMTFTIDSSTKISAKGDKPSAPPAAGQPAAKNLELKDLKAGDDVTVKYTSSGGKNVAKSIEVKASAT